MKMNDGRVGAALFLIWESDEAQAAAAGRRAVKRGKRAVAPGVRMGRFRIERTEC